MVSACPRPPETDASPEFHREGYLFQEFADKHRLQARKPQQRLGIMTVPRTVLLDRSHNFRDIGGLPTRFGASMPSGLFYRSDSLHRLTLEDNEKLQRLGIRLIVDLRTPNERKRRVFRIPRESGIRVESIPIYPISEDPTSFRRMVWFLSGRFRNFDFEQFMFEFYDRIAFEHSQQIRRVIELLASQHNRPAIIHCTGGKDRTGWISALLQALAGVPRKRILEDYLLTNRNISSVVEQSGKAIRRYVPFGIRLHSIEPVMEARREYLLRTLDRVSGRYGTMERYLTQGCGIPHGTVDNLKSVLRSGCSSRAKWGAAFRLLVSRIRGDRLFV